jgi:hypothetical protein
MVNEKISGSSAVLMQGLIYLFCAPFIVILVYFIFNSIISPDGKLFLAIILIAIILIMRIALLYGDIYLSQEKLIIKKILGSKAVPLSQVAAVDEGLLPFVYYIKLKNNKKIYFQLKPKDIFKGIINSESNATLNSLRSKLKVSSDE